MFENLLSYDGQSCAKSDATGKVHWGLSTRSRNHLCMEPHDDKLEDGSKDCPACLESEPCQLKVCPQWAQWAEWSGCSCECGATMVSDSSF